MENPILNINDDSITLNTLNSFLIDSDKDLLNLNSNLVEYSKRDTIIKQGSKASHILYINQGLIKISKEVRKDKNLILNIEGSNKFIGLSSVFGGDTYNYSITALEPTIVSLLI